MRGASAPAAEPSVNNGTASCDRPAEEGSNLEGLFEDQVDILVPDAANHLGAVQPGTVRGEFEAQSCQGLGSLLSFIPHALRGEWSTKVAAMDRVPSPLSMSSTILDCCGKSMSDAVVIFPESAIFKLPFVRGYPVLMPVAVQPCDHVWISGEQTQDCASIQRRPTAVGRVSSSSKVESGWWLNKTTRRSSAEDCGDLAL